MFWNKPTDPVCKMKLKKVTQFKSEFQNKTYHFCSLNCKQKFDKSPREYAK
ncbi:YHS domain-containing protein [Candidatus Woesearchaeota archaeon]|nr:YHS domain-containing protein [Candidatus Woesearchaeota archaeon]